MKHVVFLLMIAGAFMTTACSTTGTSTESDQGSSAETTPAAPAKATDSPAPTETATKKAAPAAAESQAPATAGSSSDGTDITYVCTHNGSVRTIKVVYPNEGPNVCEVIYEKSTGTQTLWSASNDASYCEDKAIEFVSKQEGWGWQCNQQ